MEYYAHTVPGRPEKEWEPLWRHLLEVGQGGRELGGRFGAGDLVALAGLLHDVGKFGETFQARLRNPALTADHSTAGALWACKAWPTRWGCLLAHVVAGHHAGLKDDLLGSGGRIDSNAALLPPIEQAARAAGFTTPNHATSPPGMKALKTAEGGFQLAFLTRMIFSCLIEADRTAAAAFEARAQGKPNPSAVYPSIAAVEAELHQWMQRQTISPSALNTLRDEILHAAIARADDPQGVFTLTVPTGGGKTLSSLAFALAHARRHDLDRVVVVIPFTSIVEQTAAVYRAALGSLGDAVLEHHSAFEMTDETTWSRDPVGPERLRLSMERWDNPIVVTTAVQFFESLFSDRTTRCRKLHSLARSVVVLDEAQTMPLQLLRPCVAALKELARNYHTTVVLCTATQPALAAPTPTQPGFYGGFKEPMEIAPDPVRLFHALRRVTVRDIGIQDDAALAARMWRSEQVLCVVNQRAHARELFAAIRTLPGARHLSTCMHSVHRARVLAEIRADLKAKRPCRVVSTSLIEAGVDVDFGLVLRASAGLDQIAQAAGRCNREFRQTPEASEVLVFQAAQYGVIGPVVAQADSGKEIMGLHPNDPIGLAAIRRYFEMVYWKKGPEELDRHAVMAMCGDHKGDMNFPFATIARAMRFIDDVMVPVIVAKEEAAPGEVAALVQELRYAKGVGGIARKLGRYTVGVPRRVRTAMIAAQVAEIIRLPDFGDQFVVLHNLDLYGGDVGLDWADLSFREIDKMIAV